MYILILGVNPTPEFTTIMLRSVVVT
jgi:hypothetical protein